MPKPQQNNLLLQKLPYFNIQRQHDTLRGDALAAFEKVYLSGAYVLGPSLKDFEKKFAAYTGTAYAVGVGSGTDALIFGLKATGIMPGDEVIVPSFTFTATVLAVLHLGAIPVFADVDARSFTLDPESVWKALSKKTKAIIPVHLFGQCADMTALTEIARTRKLKIIEDACQAHGASWNGKKAGALGTVGAFSFYPTKNLGGIGDGGMLTTQNRTIDQHVLQYRNLGKGIANSLVHDEIGWTSRLDSVQAAFLAIKLEKLDALNAERRILAANFAKKLKMTPLILPEEMPGAFHVYHIYVVRVPGGKRDALKTYLETEGIPTMIHYAVPVHRQPVVKKYKTRKVELPITEKLSKEVLTLPFFPGMTDQELGMTADAIRKFFGA